LFTRAKNNFLYERIYISEEIEMSDKTKKLIKAAKLGRKIDWWYFVARIAKCMHDSATKLNEKAINKITDSTLEQDALIVEISGMRTNFYSSRVH
jgi:hypothetical protein